MIFVRKVIADPPSFFTLLSVPSYERALAGVSIFSGGREVVEVKNSSHVVPAFLVASRPNAILKRAYTVQGRRTRTPYIRIRFGEKFLRICGLGEAEMIYVAIFEEAGRKIFLGWTDPAEWGLLNKFNLAAELGAFQANRWHVRFRPRLLGGLLSARQESLRRNRKIRRALHRRLGRDSVRVTAPVLRDALGVGYVAFYFRGGRYVFYGFNGSSWVDVEIGERTVAGRGHCKVIRFFEYHPVRLSPNKVPCRAYLLGVWNGADFHFEDHPVPLNLSRRG